MFKTCIFYMAILLHYVFNIYWGAWRKKTPRPTMRKNYNRGLGEVAPIFTEMKVGKLGPSWASYCIPLDPKCPWKNEGFTPPYFAQKIEGNMGSHGK